MIILEATTTRRTFRGVNERHCRSARADRNKFEAHLTGIVFNLEVKLNRLHHCRARRNPLAERTDQPQPIVKLTEISHDAFR